MSVRHWPGHLAFRRWPTCWSRSRGRTREAPIRRLFDTVRPEPDWTLEILDGAVGPTLVERASGAHLLVVGTREHVGFARVMSGSVSHYCLNHSTCPVVAVPPADLAPATAIARRRTGRRTRGGLMNRPEIVVGFDDSPAAEAALIWAGAEAVRRKATVRAVHALSWPYGADLAPGESPPVTHDEVDAAYRASITRRFDRTRPRPDWILQFAQGDAGPVLVRQAEHAIALVLGSPDHVGLGRLLAGSVAHYCVSHAQVPVICVPAGRGAAASDDRPSVASGTLSQSVGAKP